MRRPASPEALDEDLRRSSGFELGNQYILRYRSEQPLGPGGNVRVAGARVKGTWPENVGVERVQHGADQEPLAVGARQDRTRRSIVNTTLGALTISLGMCNCSPGAGDHGCACTGPL